VSKVKGERLKGTEGLKAGRLGSLKAKGRGDVSFD
jgi:hypothetical protein